MSRFTFVRRAAGYCLTAALLTGCSGSSTPAGSTAAASSATGGATLAAGSAVPAPQSQAADGRHGGRGEGGGGGRGTAATWPSGVPLPSGGGLQLSAAPGAWLASEIVDSGLDDARASVTELYRGAGYHLTSTAPDLVVLTGTSYTATVTFTAADHSPVRTAIVVHLAVR